jgi:hypothetical protein
VVWDHTNFLTDLSGQYANCKMLDKKGKEVVADRLTPEGGTVVIAIDTIEGAASDVDTVNGYIRTVIKRWTDNRQHHSQIGSAAKIGCSVRPTCSGYAVIACAFSSGAANIVKTNPPTTTAYPTRRPEPTTRYVFTARPETTTRKWWPTTARPVDTTTKRAGPDWDDDSRFPSEIPRALAFTPEQYKLAEEIMGKKWDRAHFLENLSGFETDCSMIGKNDWTFSKTQKIIRGQGLKITGLYGSAPNVGSTPDALKQILSNFKPVTTAKSIGCSVIPDCRTSGHAMQVVVSCLYEEH